MLNLWNNSSIPRAYLSFLEAPFWEHPKSKQNFQPGKGSLLKFALSKIKFLRFAVHSFLKKGPFILLQGKGPLMYLNSPSFYSGVMPSQSKKPFQNPSKFLTLFSSENAKISFVPKSPGPFLIFRFMHLRNFPLCSPFTNFKVYLG